MNLLTSDHHFAELIVLRCQRELPQYWRLQLKWGVGGAVVVQVSLTTATRGGFRLRSAISLKLSLLHLRSVLSNLTLPSIPSFPRILRFPPVVTLDPRGVALTGPLKRAA